MPARRCQNFGEPKQGFGPSMLLKLRLFCPSLLRPKATPFLICEAQNETTEEKNLDGKDPSTPGQKKKLRAIILTTSTHSNHRQSLYLVTPVKATRITMLVQRNLGA